MADIGYGKASSNQVFLPIEKIKNKSLFIFLLFCLCQL